ncbi:E3 ubiquitin-protein ligase TRIM65-like isoform X2 [Symsagittifera roscoffensis]|uniref:E3 ubiquitin-protein ligase TRIM65-like isoform X2 n=1 Tax=Symsagittifera roscoffensis TaxID=84072 RepID=UPI00307B18E8
MSKINWSDCCICLEPLQNPKSLHCGHSFCSTPKTCIERVLSSTPRRCARCRKPIDEAIRDEADLSVNYDLKSAIEDLKPTATLMERRTSIQNVCLIHKKPLKFFCNNLGCFREICEDCWIDDHVGHQVVPLKTVLSKQFEDLESNWKNIEECQDKSRNLVTESVNLNEDTLSLMEQIDQLVTSKKDLRKCENTEDFKMFKQNTLEELEKHEQLIGRIEDRACSIIASSKQVKSCLKTAKDYFLEDTACGSFQLIENVDQTRREWKDMRILNTFSNVGRVDFSVFCPVNQKLFVLSEQIIKVFRINHNSIQKETEFRIQEYLLLGISGNKIAIVDLSQSGSRAKFESIQLGQMAFFNRLFWIARDDEKSGQGYLFTSDSYEDHLSNRSYVYEMNLKNVVNGTTLLPMQIPFMSCYGNKNILFECALGTDLIFCMCGKNVFAEKTFMVKLLANL